MNLKQLLNRHGQVDQSCDTCSRLDCPFKDEKKQLESECKGSFNKSANPTSIVVKCYSYKYR